LNNVKNDYSIWGARKGVGDAEIPIHFRYAIDRKPEYYKNIEGTEFKVSNNLDWREIIYQMALDYFLYHTQDDFLIKIAKNNPNYYPLGITGYEQYYTDIQGFWRQIYDQGFKSEIIEHPENLNFWFDFLDTSGELGQFSV